MAIAGMGGSFKLAANSVSEMENWKLDIGLDTIDTTSFDSAGWKEFIAGLKEWSGSSEGSWNIATDANGQKALQDAYLSGSILTANFFVDATHNYSGSVIIQRLSIDTPVGDKVKFSVELRGTGQLSYV